MLKIGDPAPAFSLASDSGQTIASSGLKGRRHVLYFYPKDDTPGCTKEACAFRDNLPAFDQLGVPVFGVSADSDKAHARFARKYSLNFPLLADPDRGLLEAYGVWVEKSMYGRKYFGIQRSTFVVGANGKIEQVWEKVSPETHATEVMAYLAGEKVAPAAAAPVKKAAVKKAAAKKPVARKTVAKKPAVKKAATKAAAKKSAATSKSTGKKVAASRKPAKKR